VGVPDRVAVAVDALEVSPDDRLLELGCGNGAAAELVAARLGAGSITAIDRSATAIARARVRLAQHVASGRVVLEQTALEDLDLPAAAYDTIFAIDVNVFWTTPDAGDVERLLRSLRPGGLLALFFEPPVADGVERIEDVVTGTFASAGIAASSVVHERERRAVLEVRARSDG
jgi:trans-aconitate methyltransferase